MKNIFTDKISGSKSNRPGLDKCFARPRKGDILIVWGLGRLGRSMPHLTNLIQDLKKRGIEFKSLSDGAIDTTTASGELTFHIFSSLARFEKRRIQERTQAGLLAARAKGNIGGGKSLRPNGPRLVKAGRMKAGEICRRLKISRSALYRRLNLT